MFDIVQMRKGKRAASNVTVGGSPILLCADNNSRKSVIFQNQGSGTVFLGHDDVATSGSTRGYALFTGASFTDDASDEAWYAIGTGSDIVHVEEVT